jgi:hypothetical protein
MILVLGILDALLNGKGISIDIQDLQIPELNPLIDPLPKIRKHLLKGPDEVIPHRKHIKLGAAIQPLQLGYLIIVQRQVSQIDQRIQPLNLGNSVERQVQPFEVD